MTEQEYMDVGDLQLLRAVKDILRRVNCFDPQHTPLLATARKNIGRIILNLEDKLQDIEQ